MKLYYATLNVDVMFLADQEGQSLIKEARHFLLEEEKNIVAGRMSLKEVTSLSQIPDSWEDAHIWGTDDELTAREFLAQRDDEYAEYLRLKKKFEKQ